MEEMKKTEKYCPKKMSKLLVPVTSYLHSVRFQGEVKIKPVKDGFEIMVEGIGQVLEEDSTSEKDAMAKSMDSEALTELTRRMIDLVTIGKFSEAEKIKLNIMETYDEQLAIKILNEVAAEAISEIMIEKLSKTNKKNCPGCQA